MPFIWTFPNYGVLCEGKDLGNYTSETLKQLQGTDSALIQLLYASQLRISLLSAIK